MDELLKLLRAHPDAEVRFSAVAGAPQIKISLIQWPEEYASRSVDVKVNEAYLTLGGSNALELSIRTLGRAMFGDPTKPPKKPSYNPEE